MSVLSLIPEDRKKEQRKESLESVYSSNSRLNLLNKRKRLNPLNDAMSNHSLNGRPDKFVTQRVLSAKTHRVKQLQNQLADAHYHLQELSNENRVLRALQKKQEIALQRYENSNAELPQVLNSHSEEMRVQQTKYKQLKQQYKETAQKLKERDTQLQQLKDEHQHLLELSKDRNLLEREKLQAQVADLTLKVNSQNETISMLQRRIALEAKNFRHQLQNEINKHKDTRHDLDLAITNADKLSTIIEMKEKMLSTAASRSVKSPVKSSSLTTIPRPVSKNKPGQENTRSDERNVEQSFLAKLCENSRNISSAMSHDDTSSSTEPRSAYARSRTNSTSRSTPNPRKPSKSSSDDNMLELAKTVQDGMADLAIFDEVDFQNTHPDEVQKKIESMKADLLTKIKMNEEPSSRKSSALRRGSIEHSIEEQIEEEEEAEERPKSRGRRHSNVSFYDDVTVEETTTTVKINSHNMIENEIMKPKREVSNLDRTLGSADKDRVMPKRENSNLDKKLAGKPIDKYCKDIIQDIEKSSKVIDRHLKQFKSSQFESDKLVQQLQVVDKINDYVNTNGEIPTEALTELNNNFKMLTDQVFTDIPVPRKRSLSGRRGSRTESKTNLLGDSNLTNQDLLDDLLGKK
ncbi:filamin-A-interacting protein 1 [Plodia interpunctella]|uniref:filamin-A-interacting protein 1 n=1 Tax=Plodia interpunctella TaxID=58824 RepID=UPI00236825FC|nr:filamin-A-interacting protein 1 [Plodia interpunctella]